MYQRTIIYHNDNDEKLTIRQLLQKWLIPKKWQHFLRIEQNILINGKYKSFNNEVQSEDIVTLNFNFPPRTIEQHYLPGSRKLDIAYEDDDVLIVNKSANIKTHPNLPIETDSLFNDAEAYLQPNHPYMVHRIDMLTSGLVLIAKNPYLVPIFNRELTTKTLKRQYLAVVRLIKPIKHDGQINSPIGFDENDKRKRKVIPNGQSATTDYKILRKNSEYALLKLNLQTGRTHQIRVHLSSKGWPIVNDILYNPEQATGNMLLSANKLQYKIPFSDDFKTVEIEPSEDIKNFLLEHDLSELDK
ncbi:RluA family pseudouridine synthase [Companilactobacillus ginsenosidimutans]|uniref:RNA pseudouridylate synthase n=1 Tax=Companilactobacillus ginsenosidimutans TaxID=1007676 RepID=A0A0H4QJD4_9LACO|nr:RluA family pseudouridine synthase [Companilactobacillus ginsenosidimutans]AKP66788.1 hypothetical protein ABM34_03865 [Companilactobacillus ginsenosidimutans]